jgi:hypothetical protein
MSYIYNLVDTWASGGGPYTSIKMNATDNDTGSASLLMDLLVGGSSKFQVAKDGSIGIPGAKSLYQIGNAGFNITFNGSGSIGLNGAGSGVAINGPVTIGATDLILTRRAAANLRFGAVDAAAPVAQTLSVQSVVAGTTNTAGANLTITGSQGTGNAAGGSIIFQVAPAGSSGSAQNALATALTINSAGQLLFAGSASAGLFKQSASNYIESITGFSMGAGSTTGASMDGNGLTAGPSGQIGFASGNAVGARDTILARDAANTLALRNGTAAQTFNIYDTYTDASNYRRASMYWSGGAFYIDNDVNAGTGITNATLYVKTRGNLHLVAGAGGYDVITNGNGGGSLYPGGTTNTTGFGRSDRTWSNGFFGTSVQLAPATAIPAGGTAGLGYRVSSTANFGVFFGSGAPTLSAAKGSLYLRSDGSTTNDRMYVNTDGSTTWTAVTTTA